VAGEMMSLQRKPQSHDKCKVKNSLKYITIQSWIHLTVYGTIVLRSLFTGVVNGAALDMSIGILNAGVFITVSIPSPIGAKVDPS